MPFARFGEYLHKRSVLLASEQLSPEQRQSLGQAIMREEDDWFDWKASLEMRDSWLGLRQRPGVWLHRTQQRYSTCAASVPGKGRTGDVGE